MKCMWCQKLERFTTVWKYLLQVRHVTPFRKQCSYKLKGLTRGTPCPPSHSKVIQASLNWHMTQVLKNLTFTVPLAVLGGCIRGEKTLVKGGEDNIGGSHLWECIPNLLNFARGWTHTPTPHYARLWAWPNTISSDYIQTKLY